MSYMEHYKFRTQPFSEHAGKDSLWRDGRMEGEGKGVRRGKRGQEPGEGKGVRSRIGVLGKLPWSAEIVERRFQIVFSGCAFYPTWITEGLASSNCSWSCFSSFSFNA